MNNNDYQDLPAISSHWLIAMLDSPAACWRKYLDPQRPAEEADRRAPAGNPRSLSWR